jgi:succinate dehydrogenase flavin-adding protein (antitoxin of CptAB toxin-antitoxin module)
MQSQEKFSDFLEVRKQFEPLIKKLASEVPYKRMSMTYDDILSLYDEKLMKLFTKYFEVKPKEDFLYLVLSSLKNLRNSLTKKVDSTTIHIEDMEYEFIVAPDDEPSTKDTILSLFTEFAKTKLSRSEFTLFQVVTWPPAFIVSRINNLDKRIPSNVILEFFDKEVNSYNIKTLNTLRRSLDFKLEKLIPEFRLSHDLSY